MLNVFILNVFISHIHLVQIFLALYQRNIYSLHHNISFSTLPNFTFIHHIVYNYPSLTFPELNVADKDTE